MPKETVTYCGAGGAPIAVPFSCSQNLLPKEMILFSMINFRALNKATRGTWLTGAVLMFVYINLASAVMILQPGGM
eukprot:13160418-Ditylum_brightwellii.AAC.1